MKALIFVKAKELDWIKPIFSNQHLLLIKICNKPYLEYLVDFAILCGCREIKLVTDAGIGEVETLLDDGSRWGIKLSYAPIRETDNLEDALEKNSGFCKGSPLLLFKGFFFLHYDKNTEYADFIKDLPSGEIKSCETGSLSLIKSPVRDGHLPGSNQPLLEASPLTSATDIHTLSLDILTNNSNRYVLPGYSSDNQTFIGQNVIITKKSQIIPPVIIGNQVQIHNNAIVGPGAIIGSEVIIDSNCRIVESIVFDKTYVGEHLELRKKLIAGNLVVNSEDGTLVRLEDDHLLSQVKIPSFRITFLHRIFNLINALLAVLILAVPYILFSSLLKSQKKWTTRERTVFVNSDGLTKDLTETKIQTSGLGAKLASILLLDRYPLLFSVLNGSLILIGSRLLEAEKKNLKVLEDYSSYRPGVFSYAEAETWPEENAEWEIVERFHLARRGLVHDNIMLAKAIINRAYPKENE
jgi:NDP-sugar pyrophosphorylase family protein